MTIIQDVIQAYISAIRVITRLICEGATVG